MAEISRRQEQLQNNLSVINGSLAKIDEDGRDRSTNLRDELRNVEAQHSQLISDLSTKLSLELTAMSTRV